MLRGSHGFTVGRPDISNIIPSAWEVFSHIISAHTGVRNHTVLLIFVVCMGCPTSTTKSWTFSSKGHTFGKTHFPSLYPNNELCNINSIWLSCSGYSKELLIFR